MKRIILIFCFFVFQVSFACAIVKEDSLKSRFNINDPRNPNCPCHKYQKLADEEYKKLRGKEIRLDTTKTENNHNTAFKGNKELNSGAGVGTKKIRSRNHTWSFFDHKKKKSSKRKKIKWFRKDNTRCFHF